MDMRLLLKGEDNYLKLLTDISGGVDNNKIFPAIIAAQDSEMRRVLGEELFLKLLDDVNNDSLSGLYLEMYDKCIAKMVVYYSAALFVELQQTDVVNQGILVNTPNNTQSADSKRVDRKIKRYRDLGVNQELQFEKFIKDNPVPEYKIDNPSQGNSYKFNWFLK